MIGLAGRWQERPSKTIKKIKTETATNSESKPTRLDKKTK